MTVTRPHFTLEYIEIARTSTSQPIGNPNPVSGLNEARLKNDAVAENEIWSIFNTLRNLTIELESIQQGDTSSNLWVQFNSQRTFTEYLLVNMNTYESATNPAEGFCHIQESCRLACLLYMNVILRQLPPTSACVGKLTEFMRRSVEKTDLSLGWKDRSDLLWWALFLGLTASTSRSETLWFLSHSAVLAPSLEIFDWPSARSTLQRVAWPCRLLEAAHVIFWGQIQQML
jgi:hypothetical protein